MQPSKRSVVMVEILSSAMAFAAIGAEEPAASHFWELGVGSYGSISGPECGHYQFSDLDYARLGWSMICYGNYVAKPEVYNRQLKINPRHKYLVRLWPNGFIGPGDKQPYAGFMDYFYAKGIKERILSNISDQIRLVLSRIDKPENVMGFTLLEELPCYFGDGAINSLDENELTAGLKVYQKQIEAERGKPLRWDNETRRWWGEKFVQALNEVHQHIKKESGGKWVLFWLMNLYEVLDYYPEGTDLRKKGLLPFYLREVIKPGSCDGFFAYPNNPRVWERYMALAQKNNWLFFSQLSHPGGMRLDSWEQCVRLAETKVPQNLGYFFYCEGNCVRGAWNDDPSIPPHDSYSFYSPISCSVRSHLRRHCAERNVGMEIVERQLLPEVQLSYDSTKGAPDENILFRALIHNGRDDSWYLKNEEASLKNARITLQLPEGYVLPPTGIAATLGLGDLPANAYRAVDWWAKKKGQPAPVGESNRVVVVIEADNCPRTALEFTEPASTIQPAGSFEARRSGDGNGYAAFHLSGDQPIDVRITFECLRGAAATHPSITINGSRASWSGTILGGQTLVFEPGRKAFLKPDATAAPSDVSGQLQGQPVALKAEIINHLVYGDDDLPLPLAKVRITVEPVVGKK